MKILIAILLMAGMAHASVEGTYTGEFEGRKGTITLTPDHQMTFVGDDGRPWLRGCEDQIGAVTDVKAKRNEIKKITYEYKPGKCVSVLGNEIEASFNGKGTLKLELLAGHESYEDCFYDQYGRRHCQTRNWPVYMSGKFKKQ